MELLVSFVKFCEVLSLFLLHEYLLMSGNITASTGSGSSTNYTTKLLILINLFEIAS